MRASHYGVGSELRESADRLERVVQFMVLGLAPAFILGVFLRAPAAAFHLAFWTGIVAGIIEVLGLVPGWMVMGDGRYGALLGVNVWGQCVATGLYLAVWAMAHARDRIAAEPVVALGGSRRIW